MAPEHQAKVRECLALLQEAQGLVNAAASALREWSEMTGVYSAIKNQWYAVEARRMRDMRAPAT